MPPIFLMFCFCFWFYFLLDTSTQQDWCYLNEDGELGLAYQGLKQVARSLISILLFSYCSPTLLPLIPKITAYCFNKLFHGNFLKISGLVVPGGVKDYPLEMYGSTCLSDINVCELMGNLLTCLSWYPQAVGGSAADSVQEPQRWTRSPSHSDWVTERRHREKAGNVELYSISITRG